MTTQMRMDPYREMPLSQHMKTPAAGRVFYVNTAANNAADTNDGTTPETAFLTIDYAIGQCTTLLDDYIFVMGHDNGTETYPIVMDVSNVHLIGRPGTPPLISLQVQSDADVIDLTGEACEISGFHFDNLADGYTNRLIDLVGSGNHIHDNYFAWWGFGYDCIHCRGGNANNILIDRNYFGAHGYARYAVYTDASPTRVVVRDNVIVNNGAWKNGTTGIYLASDAYSCALDNKFKVAGGANGQAIVLYGTACYATGNEVCGPQTGFGAFNPFRTNVLQSNFWGINYAGPTPTLPIAI